MRSRYAFLLCLAAPAFAAQSCESLAKLSLPATTIARAEVVPAGALPAYCLVAGTIEPSAGSGIQFEVWMPAAGWNRKFQAVGNGGFAGSINYRQMGAAVAQGYATASTDAGHKGSSIDAEWALAHREKVVDFGYRAIHEMTVKAKAIVEAFYGERPRRSYFGSCSNGGRQALMEVQRFPEDYDGAIAGAPANNWTRMLANGVSNLVAMAEAFIPPAKLRAIQDAALAACDAGDGVKDRTIENPAACRFDPGALLCRGAETDACLTAPQMATLKKLYAGTRVFPGYAPGGEAENGGWTPWLTGPALEQSLMYSFGTQYFKYMVFENREWDYRTFQLDRDLAAAEKKTGAMLNAVDPDLSRFAARGGKLIVYHGWCDAAIAPQNAIDYYQSVAKKMGAAKARGFVRLFMVPGMQHCGGGPIANPGVEIAAALERWVERGVAPDRIVVAMGAGAHPLCAYPAVARYKGSGSAEDAANYECMMRAQ
jgi:hypothetical protein